MTEWRSSRDTVCGLKGPGFETRGLIPFQLQLDLKTCRKVLWRSRALCNPSFGSRTSHKRLEHHLVHTWVKSCALLDARDFLTQGGCVEVAAIISTSWWWMSSPCNLHGGEEKTRLCWVTGEVPRGLEAPDLPTDPGD